MEKEKYVSPHIEVIEVEVEKGFATSSYIDIDPDGTGNAAAAGHRGEWGDLWE